MLGIQWVSIILHAQKSISLLLSSILSQLTMCFTRMLHSLWNPAARCCLLAQERVLDLRWPIIRVHPRPQPMDHVRWKRSLSWDFWPWDQRQQVLVALWRQSCERWAIDSLESHASCHVDNASLRETCREKQGWEIERIVSMCKDLGLPVFLLFQSFGNLP